MHSIATLNEVIQESGLTHPLQVSTYYSREFVPYDPLRASNTPEESEIPNEHDKWVLVIRRVFEDKNKLLKTKLDIKSPLIVEVLQETLEEEKAELATGRASLDWPHNLLFRYVCTPFRIYALRESIPDL